ncbi:hypothetical protein [Amphritea sp.]|uniref:hypothetical protein n=1 Tax=Amphritea sp. TaxID=1872502 RepID=UPI00356953E2
MRKGMITFLVATSLAAVPVSVLAKKPEGAGNGEHRNEQRSEYQQSGSEYEHRKQEKHSEQISREDRRRIQEYYQSKERDSKDVNPGGGKGKDKQRALPQGLQKKLDRGGQLPPGWEKKVVAGEVLDGELYRHSERLPYDLDRELGRAAGEEYRRIGNKVVRVLEGDATVIDVIDILDTTGVLK